MQTERTSTPAAPTHHVEGLRLPPSGRWISACDCHLQGAEVGGASGDLPAPNCHKCQGEGEIYARAR